LLAGSERHRLGEMPKRAELPQRLLTTVMFTDIVESTNLAASVGDRRWRQLLSRHHATVRRTLRRHGGREIDTAGDGFFARFDQPARAVSCALELTRALAALGIQIRAGIHMGEVEAIGPKVSGIAVHLGSRVLSKASPGEVLVSGTVRDLMAGSDLRFEDRGIHELKGVPGEWRLYAVTDAGTQAGVDEAAEAEAPVGARARPAGRRRLAMVAIVVTGVVAVLIVPPFLALRTRNSPPAFVPAPGTVARLDPSTGELAGGARVGTTPTAVAFGEGMVWVANFDDRTVQTVDPETNEAGRTIGLTVDGHPAAIVVGGGFAWVASGISGEVFKIDPTTRAAQPIDAGVGVARVAFADGAVWATNTQADTILRIDAASFDIRTFPLKAGSGPRGIVIGAGSVWVANSLAGAVIRMDPASGMILATIPVLEGRPEELTFGEGFVWVTNPPADSMLRIDPSSNQALTIERVGNGPVGVAAGNGSVWVANSLDGTVVRIAPVTGKVTHRIKLGFGLEGVTMSPGVLWVTVHER
jgi:class 3 adenylate cyclase/streptogramin lyase